MVRHRSHAPDESGDTTPAQIACSQQAAIGRALDWWHLAPLGTAIVALGLLVVGVLAAMFVNRSWWTSVLLLLMLPPLIGLLVVRPDLSGGVGDRTARPVSRAEAAAEQHELGIGELTIDLTDMSLGGDALAVGARVGIGHLAVIVPDGAALVVDADLGAGSVEVEVTRCCPGSTTARSSTSTGAAVAAGSGST